LAPDAESVAVDGQTGDPDSLLSHYRSLTRLRDAHSALRTGELIPIDAEPRGIYAYLRHDTSDVVAVVANLTDEPVGDISLTLASGPLCGRLSARTLLGTAEARAPEVNQSGGFDAYRPVDHLDPRQAVVISLSP
jgi:alpha-amylase